MLKRIITALVALCVFIPVVIFSDTYLFPIGISFGCTVALYEMLKCIDVLKLWFLSIPLVFGCGCLPIVARYFDNHEYELLFVMLAIAVVTVMYIFAVSLFSKGKFSIERAGLTFMTTFYISGGFTSIVLLRDFQDVGLYLFMLIFVGAWMTDIFAYFVGRFFGRHKLIPEISPKKTIEGSIGGIVFCSLSFVLYGFILSHFTSISLTSYIVLAIVGIIISVVSQIGDLTMSQIKRQFGVKDYGWILPGHGGMLDRFDSILAVSLVLVVACAIVRHFGINIITV
jgi:phosphatidate cytidylyltransferase